MQQIEKEVEEEFSFPVAAVFYNNMEIAMEAYDRLLAEHQSLFRFEKSTTSKGHLRTLFVEKQFNDCSFNPRSQYSVRLKEVNKCKHKALFVEMDKFTLNIAHTWRENNLPSKAAYKMEYAKWNKPFDNQYELKLDDNGEIDDNIVLPKHYGFITYGVQNGTLKHLDIIIPAHDFSGYLARKNLLENANVYKGYVPDEVKEENVAALKKGIVKEQNII